MVIVNGSNAEKVRDDILEEHSMLDRLNIFDLDVELKVSFMGGMIEVEGMIAMLCFCLDAVMQMLPKYV